MLTWIILAAFGLPLYYVIKQQLALKASRKKALEEISKEIEDRQRASIAVKRKKLRTKTRLYGSGSLSNNT